MACREAEAVLDDVLHALGLSDDDAVSDEKRRAALTIINCALSEAGDEAIEAEHDRRADERAWRRGVGVHS